ncbi:hypothetical protein CBR_g36458 [Chara braunii]|uniref:ER membrane protein complex subunit 10 n=1 Tax=Chara braunii TaxID=69332 RepID=A0A388LL05_CHABU|nr:hypothetical protein CBR_g36458 [Chara braunii]|eukprot:GBG82931.1 hypothetical protein CBR_g36458 [Chara braunii]
MPQRWHPLHAVTDAVSRLSQLLRQLVSSDCVLACAIGGGDGFGPFGCILGVRGAVAKGEGGKDVRFDDLLDEDDEEFTGFEDPIHKLRTSSEALGDSTVSLSSVFPSASMSTSASKVAGDVSVVFEHDLGGKGLKFEPCGEFMARGKPSADPQSLFLFVSRHPWTSQQQKDFLELLESDGVYRIRVPTNFWKRGNETVMSYVKARCLAAAGFQERFEFVVDYTGNVVAVNYLLPDGACHPLSSVKPKSWRFSSKAVLKPWTTATGPLVTAEGDPMADTQEGERPKKKEEKSFFARYWMYIVPGVLVFMNVMAQATATLEQQQQQQQQGAERSVQRPGGAGMHGGGAGRRRAVQ